MKPTKKMQCALAALLTVCAAATGAFAEETAAPVTATINAKPGIVASHNGLNLTGAVGMPLNPTANIPNRGSYRVQADYFDLGNIDAKNNFGSNFDRDQKIGDARFYGIHAATGIGSRFEISGGVDALRLRGEQNVGDDNDSFSFDDNDGTGFSVGAKYQAYHSADGTTLVAVGAGYSKSLFRNTNAYVVGTKAFGVGNRSITGHLGVRYDRFSLKGLDQYDGDQVSFEDDSSKVSVFAGTEVPLDRNGRFAFVGEIGSRNAEDFNVGDFDFGGPAAHVETKFPYSASVRYARNGLAASVGVARQGVTGDSGLFAQIGKTF